MGLKGEPAEAARRDRMAAGPSQRLAQRGRICRNRAIDFQRGSITHGAVKRGFERGSIEAEFQSGVVASQCIREVGDGETRVDQFLMPSEMPGSGEAFRDRWPSER